MLLKINFTFFARIIEDIFFVLQHVIGNHPMAVEPQSSIRENIGSDILIGDLFTMQASMRKPCQEARLSMQGQRSALIAN